MSTPRNSLLVLKGLDNGTISHSMGLKSPIIPRKRDKDIGIVP